MLLIKIFGQSNNFRIYFQQRLKLPRNGLSPSPQRELLFGSHSQIHRIIFRPDPVIPFRFSGILHSLLPRQLLDVSPLLPFNTSLHGEHYCPHPPTEPHRAPWHRDNSNDSLREARQQVEEGHQRPPYSMGPHSHRPGSPLPVRLRHHEMARCS